MGAAMVAGHASKRLWLASTVALAVIAAAGHAQAQDAGTTTLETVTVDGGKDTGRGPDKGIVAKSSRSASKTTTSLRETPQAVSVVTRDEIDARGANSVREALRYTPGVLAEANGDDVRGGWMWLRGYNAYGRLWLDGLALAGDPEGYASWPINSYALERVEVIKGPASVLYGQTLPGGLVNQVSKRPQTTAHNEVEVTTSSLGGIQTSVDFTGPLGDGDWSYRLVGQGRDLGSQIDKERNRQLMLSPSLTWSPDEDTSLTVYGLYQKVKPENFSGRFYPAFGTLINNPAGQIPTSAHMGDYLSNADAFDADLYTAGYEFSHALNENLTFRQNLRYSYAEQNMFLAVINPAFTWPKNPPSGTTLGRVVSASDDNLSSIDIDNQLEARFDTGALDHTMLFGFEYFHLKSDRYFGTANIAGQDYLNPVYGRTYAFPAWNTTSAVSTQNQIGLYVQDQVRYDNWLATLGLRYDHSKIETEDRLKKINYDTTDSAISGRAGLAYLFDNGVTPYASVSTSFLPTVGLDVYGNPYTAQESRQFEVGVKYEPEGGRGMIGVSLFDLTLENGLTQTTVAGKRGNVQTGEQRIRGIEIEGKYELTPELEIVASYAYSASKVLETKVATQIGQDMLRVPAHQGALWVQYRPDWAEGLTLNAGVRATSSYHTDVTYLKSLEIPSLALVDIGAQYDLGALNKDFTGATLRLNVSNLFDKTHVIQCINDTGGSCNYGPGRTITASLKYEW